MRLSELSRANPIARALCVATLSFWISGCDDFFLGKQTPTFADMQQISIMLQDSVNQKGRIDTAEAEIIISRLNDGRDRWGMPFVFATIEEPEFSFILVSFGSDRKLDVKNIEDYFKISFVDIVGQPHCDIVFRDGVAITRASPK